MVEPPDIKGLLYYLGSVALILFGLGTVGVLLMGLGIKQDLPHAMPGIYQYRTSLNGPVRRVVAEEMTVSALGNSSLTRADTAVYDRQGNRIGIRRDTVHSTGWKQHSPGPGAVDMSRDVAPPARSFGFRLVLDDDLSGSQLRSRYAFDVKHPYRYEQFLYGHDGRLERRYVHVDDPSGTYASWTRNSADGDFDGRNITVYNDRGDFLEQKRYSASDSLDFHWTYTYNDRGELTELASLDEDGVPKRKFVYIYEYDEQGNWTQRTTLGFTTGGSEESTFVPRVVIRRTITYY
ncbi:MAG: hypothetical protein JSU77_03040 [Fidelibacterota bacterium]|nr:MAG: hypothetical protein JSU77_03040 [Candidatus Neomarinimicrobiota bacterium]